MRRLNILAKRFVKYSNDIILDIPTVARNAAIRGPRHAVFLRDRTPTRHCAFSEDGPQMGYAQSKLNVDNIRASYPPPEHQVFNVFKWSLHHCSLNR